METNAKVYVHIKKKANENKSKFNDKSKWN